MSPFDPCELKSLQSAWRCDLSPNYPCYNRSQRSSLEGCMGRLRIKKPKERRAPQQHAVVGFPEFWPVAHQLNPVAHEELQALGRFQNDLFRKMWSEQRLQVFRHIAKLCMNSLGAVAVLSLNG